MSIYPSTYSMGFLPYWDIKAIKFLLCDFYCDETAIINSLKNYSPDHIYIHLAEIISGVPLLFDLLTYRSDSFCAELISLLSPMCMALALIRDGDQNVLQKAISLGKEQTAIAWIELFPIEQRSLFLIDDPNGNAFALAKPYPHLYLSLFLRLPYAAQRRQMRNEPSYFFKEIYSHVAFNLPQDWFKDFEDLALSHMHEIKDEDAIAILLSSITWEQFCDYLKDYGGIPTLINQVKHHELLFRAILTRYPDLQSPFQLLNIKALVDLNESLATPVIYAVILDFLPESQRCELLNNVHRFPELQSPALVEVYCARLTPQELYEFLSNSMAFFQIAVCLSCRDWLRLLETIVESFVLFDRVVCAPSMGNYLISFMEALEESQRTVLLRHYFFKLMATHSPVIIDSLLRMCQADLIRELLFSCDERGQTFFLAQVLLFSLGSFSEWLEFFKNYLNAQQLADLINQRDFDHTHVLDMLGTRENDHKIATLLIHHGSEITPNYFSSCDKAHAWNLYNSLSDKLSEIDHFIFLIAVEMKVGKIEYEDHIREGLSQKGFFFAKGLVNSPLISHDALYEDREIIETFIHSQDLTREEAWQLLPFFSPNQISTLVDGIPFRANRKILFCQSEEGALIHLTKAKKRWIDTQAYKEIRVAERLKNLVSLLEFVDLAAMSQSEHCSLLWEYIPFMNLSQLKVILPLMPVNTIFELTPKMQIRHLPLEFLTSEQKIAYFDELSIAPSASITDNNGLKKLVFLQQHLIGYPRIASLALKGEEEAVVERLKEKLAATKANLEKQIAELRARLTLISEEDSLIDNITYEKMVDPVEYRCGHIQERGMADRLLKEKNPCCPTCRAPLEGYQELNQSP